MSAADDHSERLHNALVALGQNPEQYAGPATPHRAVLLAAALSGAAEREHVEAELTTGGNDDDDLDQAADEAAWDATGWVDEPGTVLTVQLRRAARLHQALHRPEDTDPAYTTAAVAVALAEHTLRYRQAAELAEADDIDAAAASWHTRWHDEADEQLATVTNLLDELRNLIGRLTA